MDFQITLNENERRHLYEILDQSGRDDLKAQDVIRALIYLSSQDVTLASRVLSALEEEARLDGRSPGERVGLTPVDVQKALQETNGNISAASDILSCSRRNVRYFIDQYDLEY